MFVVGETISALDKNAFRVLQAIEDLQFTGRQNAKPGYGDGFLVYFDPVPFVAIYAELSPITFDLDLQLRLLKTEEAVVHSIDSFAQHRTYVRPDGKKISVFTKRGEEDDCQYVATLDRQTMCAANIHMPRGIENRNIKSTDLLNRFRIDCYRITKTGRAMLANNHKPSGTQVAINLPTKVVTSEVVPKNKPKPCWGRAISAHSWVMKNIDGAENMTYSQKFNALVNSPHYNGDDLPPNAEAFANYCRKAGISNNSPRRARRTTRSVVRQSEL